MYFILSCLHWCRERPMSTIAEKCSTGEIHTVVDVRYKHVINQLLASFIFRREFMYTAREFQYGCVWVYRDEQDLISFRLELC